MIDQSRMSRRAALRSAVLLVVAPVAATWLPSNGALAQAKKASKEAMKYQDKPNGAMQCNNCSQFEPPSGCKIVEGAVKPEGYCIAWVKKA